MITINFVLLFVVSAFLIFVLAPTETFAQKGVGSTSLENLVINDSNLKAELVFKGIQYPTSIAFLGPNDILVLEKNEGTVKRIVNGVMSEEPLLDVSVSNLKERGMLGIAVDNEGKGDKTFVYLYFTESREDGDDMLSDNPRDPLGNRLYRYELIDSKLINPKLLLDLPTTPAGTHNGGKLVIGPEKNIYLTTGDLFNYRTMTQNVVSNEPLEMGVIYRVTSDGNSAGNILGTEDPVDKFYAYGIRNSFGIDFDPLTNTLWDSENGPDFGDEINLVEPGFNSGWRLVQGLESYPSILSSDFSPDQLLSSFKEKKGGIVGFFEKTLSEETQPGIYRDPEFVWQVPIGVTDIKFFNSDKFGEKYENGLFVGDINNGNLYHFELDGDRDEFELDGPLSDKVADGFEEREAVIFGKNFGGITDLEVGPDGYLYSLSFHRSEGTIFRIVPVGGIPITDNTETDNSIIDNPPTEASIPSWIKSNAKWWSDNQISDNDFVKGIQYLIQQGIIIIPPSEDGSDSGTTIPSWIKQSAAWWADDVISDGEFVNGIQFMINSGIIQLE